jgi:hypothetical protein
MASGRQLLLESSNSAPAELLLFEFKTETVKPVDEKKKKWRANTRSKFEVAG